jgi:hypothetical protein
MRKLPFRTTEPARGVFRKVVGDGTFPKVGEAIVHVTRETEVYDAFLQRYPSPRLEWRVEIEIQKDGVKVGVAEVTFDDLLRQMRDASE